MEFIRIIHIFFILTLICSIQSTFANTHSFQCTAGSIDSDLDGICDLEDNDDDNDGITDASEGICGIPLASINMEGEGILSMDGDSIALTHFNGWRTSYSIETFSLPIHLEFKADPSTLKMIGFLPVGEPKTLIGWNDGAYKLYVHTNSLVFGKLTDVWTFNQGVMNDDRVEMDIDLSLIHI